MEKQCIMTLSYLSSLHFHKDLAATAQFHRVFNKRHGKKKKKKKKKKSLRLIFCPNRAYPRTIYLLKDDLAGGQ